MARIDLEGLWPNSILITDTLEPKYDAPSRLVEARSLQASSAVESKPS